jgi:hypothetical protein
VQLKGVARNTKANVAFPGQQAAWYPEETRAQVTTGLDVSRHAATTLGLVSVSHPFKAKTMPSPVIDLYRNVTITLLDTRQ